MERRLAAILAADVAGYSRLMAGDEAGTLAQLNQIRGEVIEPRISRFHGHIVGTAGDSFLVEFASTVDAVECAMEIQLYLAERNASFPEDRRMAFRMGVNLSDVIAEGGTIYGDGVNIAARLEKLAEPGDVLIGGSVYEQVKGKVAYHFDDLGVQQVHNIPQPIQAYRVQPHSGALARTASHTPSKRSIAVLPFTNLSSDSEQEYFADGLADDLITDLSKVPGFVVIARNSTFAYKGRTVDIRTIAKDLRVRYVLEGSVRRSATRIRINAQLIDASDQSHLWADRFDRDLTDLFMLQDEIVGKIVKATAGALPAPAVPIRRRAKSFEAYDLFVRARSILIQTPESNRVARQMLERAIEIDPGFADAHAWLAKSHQFGWSYGGEAKDPHQALALAAAQRAVELDPESADAHTILGNLLFYEGKLDECAAELGLALRIDPNHADAWLFLAEARATEGMALDGIELVRKAFRLNPNPPGWYYWMLGYALYAARQYQEAVEILRHDLTYSTGSTRLLAASLAQLGRLEEAKEEGRRFLSMYPGFSIRYWADLVPFRHEVDRQHFVDGYLKAGLPM